MLLVQAQGTTAVTQLRTWFVCSPQAVFELRGSPPPFPPPEGLLPSFPPPASQQQDHGQGQWGATPVVQHGNEEGDEDMEEAGGEAGGGAAEEGMGLGSLGQAGRAQHQHQQHGAHPVLQAAPLTTSWLAGAAGRLASHATAPPGGHLMELAHSFLRMVSPCSSSPPDCFFCHGHPCTHIESPETQSPPILNGLTPPHPAPLLALQACPPAERCCQRRSNPLTSWQSPFPRAPSTARTTTMRTGRGPTWAHGAPQGKLAVQLGLGLLVVVLVQATGG